MLYEVITFTRCCSSAGDRSSNVRKCLGFMALPCEEIPYQVADLLDDYVGLLVRHDQRRQQANDAFGCNVDEQPVV